MKENRDFEGNISEGPIAEVIVDVLAANVNRPFDYLVPPELSGKIKPGRRVLVPFGNRRVGGYVLGLIASSEVKNLKSIISISDDKIPVREELIELAGWMARKYLCLYIAALRSVLPLGGEADGVRAKEVTSIRLDIPMEKAREALAEIGRQAPLQALVLESLLSRGSEVPLAEIFKGRKIPYSSIDALVRRGIITVGKVRVRRDPLGGHSFPAEGFYRLEPAQEHALSAIEEKITRRDPKPILLHGVTGSGKTEVYLRAIEFAMRSGRDAILLVPEISLTPQMVRTLSGRFGGEIAVLHSRLSRGERYDELERIARGQVKVAVGARSAIFAPFYNLGLIIVDEEHENSYKQGESPRYHARDVALRRASLEGAALVLGSATPSLESYYCAMTGEYDYATLPFRVDGRPMPHIEIVDMREELACGNKSIFSKALIDGVRERLARREQVILFLNRRGYSTFALCRECGFVLKCKRCDVSLTYHADSRSMVCHYCGFEMRVPDVCPKCKSIYMRYFGVGTERVEAEARKTFPGAGVVRMDTDTTRNKGAHERILSAFGRGEYDLLVGTQMIAKGLDFPNVTLVGVITADTLLNLPDFRAGERTFQLLCQVAGRAGRGRVPGHVILQTYSPGHYAVKAAAEGDYEGFYRSELQFRKELDYPPFTAVTRLLVTSCDERLALRAATGIASAIRSKLPSGMHDSFSMLGPSPCAIKKVAGRFRWHIIIKARNPDDVNGAILEQAKSAIGEFDGTDVEFTCDVDPQSLL